MDRIYTINKYLKKHFGSKVVKLSIDGGFTCPNRDGTKGSGGCTFCSSSGSGELASDIPRQMELLADKWPSVDKYLAYFQSHTNTYAPVSQLREQYYEALSQDKVVGLVIATRPDCLNEDILALLDEINQKYFLWIELGLQTIHENTAKSINRCYSLDVYDDAVDKLNRLGIRYVTHLILGLPSESREDMIQSLQYVCRKNIFGIKLHMLNIVKGSQMEFLYPEYSHFQDTDDYIKFLCDLIAIIPKDITIHRLTGDTPRPILLSPKWSYKKRTILNGITKELKHRDAFQGCALESSQQKSCTD